MSHKYNIHPALYIGGFAVFFSFIFGFPIGTLMGLAIGIGISKKMKICKRVYRWRSYTGCGGLFTIVVSNYHKNSLP